MAAKAQSYIMRNRGLELESVMEAAIQKYYEHSTPFRMERRFENSNVNLARQTIGRNIAHVATNHLEKVRQAILAHVKAGPVVHMDETPVRVQAPGKGKCDTGYFWVMLRDERNWNPNAQPAVAFEYAPSRAGSVAADLLSGTSIEYLQTDSYGGYNRLFAEGNANDGIRSVKCWAHARRKFKEAVDTQKSPFVDFRRDVTR